MIRAIRLELVKPLNETWDDVGPLLRTLAKATPKLLNAALDARIAIEVAGTVAVKAKVAPEAKAASGDGLAYQAVLRSIERLREWGMKKQHPFAELAVPGGMASAIGRAASKAYARRDQQRPKFASERILVRATETEIMQDERGITLVLQLRPSGRVRFACAGSWGTHRDTLRQIVASRPIVEQADALHQMALKNAKASGKDKPKPRPPVDWEPGDCKIQYDERRKKWYALLAYEAPEPAPLTVDPRRVLAVHRGARNALYLLSSTGERGLAFPGSKLLAQRRKLSARAREIKRTSELERGSGSKGHGRSRRYEAYSALEDKIARVTHTFCQQAAAFVSATAERFGCARVVIEDYGGIVEDDADVRRVLDHGPLYALKQAVEHRCKKDGRTLDEVPSTYISSKCPRCAALDSSAHNTRTGIFHCKACVFERPADWVAAYWMLMSSGADMSVWTDRLEQERKFVEAANKVKETAEAADNKVKGIDEAAE